MSRVCKLLSLSLVLATTISLSKCPWASAAESDAVPNPPVKAEPDSGAIASSGAGTVVKSPATKPATKPAASKTASPGAAAGSKPSVPYSTKARIQSAKEQIKANESFKLHANQFHTEAAANLEQSKRLEGAARSLELRLKTGSGKLDPARLKSALNQFNLDLEAFKVHARQYAAHMDKMKAQIGECHNDEKEYQANLENYLLHCKQYHLPDIRPPHLCPGMEMTQARATELNARLSRDNNKVVAQTAALNEAEGKLLDAVRSSPLLDAKVLKENKRAEIETQLAAEYARLKEEYDLLSIEKSTIDGKPNATTAEATVNGRVKK